MKTGCTIQNKSLTAQVVHEAEITNSTDAVLKTSYGLTETTFKEDTENIKHYLIKYIAWKTLNYQSLYVYWKTKIKHRLSNRLSLKRLIVELN